jgi:hypothetical protein
MMLSFIEFADPGYDRRVFKCACGHVEDIKVRIDRGSGLGWRSEAHRALIIVRHRLRRIVIGTRRRSGA